MVLIFLEVVNTSESTFGVSAGTYIFLESKRTSFFAEQLSQCSIWFVAVFEDCTSVLQIWGFS